jgi:hypothetical protein
MTRIPATVLCLLFITIYFSACGGDGSNDGSTLTSSETTDEADVNKSVADEAIRCSGLFYLLTAIPENQAASQVAIMMGELYRAHASELMGKEVSNGDVLTARDETAEALRAEYDANPDGVTDLALRCNSWRASIAATFQDAVRESKDGTLESDTEKFMLSVTAPLDTPSVPEGDRLSIDEVIRQAMESQPPESRQEVLEKLRKLSEESK